MLLHKHFLFSAFVGLSAAYAPHADAAPQKVPALKRFAFVNASDHRFVKVVTPRSASEFARFRGNFLEGLLIRADTPYRGNKLMIRYDLQRAGRSIFRSTAKIAPYALKNALATRGKTLPAGRYKLIATPLIKNARKKWVAGSRLIMCFALPEKTVLGGPESETTPVSRIPPGKRPTASPVSSAPPIPQLSQWQSRMLKHGRQTCNRIQDSSLNFDTRLAETYYDAQWVFYQIGDYTGDSSWYQCAQAAGAVYQKGYVVPNNGVVPGYWNFSHGATQEFLRTRNESARKTAVMLSQHASYAPDTVPLSWTADSEMSREVAYTIMSYLNAEQVGQPHRARTEPLVSQALGHLDQWFVAKNAPYVRPFMFALTAQALITYQEQTKGNAQILPALRRGANWIWENTWLPDKEAFKYTDREVSSGGTEPSPDLNLLIAPVFAWLWHQTGDVTFRDRADKIFAGGVKNAWLNNGKQFDQSYRWSFDYLRWRNAPPVR